LIDDNFQFVVDDPGFFLSIPPPPYLTLGPYRHEFAAASVLTGNRRPATFSHLDLQLARTYAPLAAYGYLNHIDYFSPHLHCQVYQPVYGIDLTLLSHRRC
jgi:hypothetical protein